MKAPHNTFAAADIFQWHEVGGPNSVRFRSLEVSSLAARIRFAVRTGDLIISLKNELLDACAN
eukprot:2547898-Karenia_brevis.AAC.1